MSETLNKHEAFDVLASFKTTLSFLVIREPRWRERALIMGLGKCLLLLSLGVSLPENKFTVIFLLKGCYCATGWKEQKVREASPGFVQRAISSQRQKAFSEWDTGGKAYELHEGYSTSPSILVTLRVQS